MKTLRISVKCSDMFSATLRENGQYIGDYSGYVPDFFPGEHYGDYVILDIDVATGKILNWRKPTERQLKELFMKPCREEEHSEKARVMG